MKNQEVIRKIESVADDLQANTANDTIWTIKIKKAIAELATPFDYEVRSTVEGTSYGSEWLYDLTFLEKDNDRIIEIPLILESEWSPKYENIAYDFDKLLQSKAKIKVMVFQQKNVQSVKEVFKKLKYSITSYSKSCSAEVYILCGLNWQSTEFSFEVV